MNKKIIVLSDLHLGAGGDLDDFKEDDRFASLLSGLLEERQRDRALQLVLLGDTFDLWQAVSKQECEEQEASRIPLEYRAGIEIEKLERVRAAHQKWFDALRRFLSQEHCFVTMVPGNHDHSLVDPEVQAKLGQLLNQRDSRLSFPLAWDEPDLGIYGEHGCQYDTSNSYKDFAGFDWQRDCPGYYFVRLFWNRVEPMAPSIDHGAIWKNAYRAVLKKPALLGKALKYFWQYWRDDRIPAHSHIGGLAFGVGAWDETGGSRIAPADLPELLIGGTVAGENVFSQDPFVEDACRKAYAESEEMRAVVKEISQDQGRPAPAVPAPTGVELQPSSTSLAMYGFGWRAPRPCDGAEEVFDAKSQRRLTKTLERSKYKYVLFGHTHYAKQEALDESITYFNTGTWKSPAQGLPYVEVTVDPGGVNAKLGRMLQDEPTVRALVRPTAISGPGLQLSSAKPPSRSFPPLAESLKAGDVLLYDGGDNFISWAIKKLDRSEVSHCGLFLGQQDWMVGEAVREGLVEQRLDESIADAKKVFVHRLATPVAQMDPVLARARSYLGQRDRYAFEQILVLAMICLTRRLPLPRLMQPLVERVLKKAGARLLELLDAGKEPTICSEFVYRAYDEALAGPDDLYRLQLASARLHLADGSRANGRAVETQSLLGLLSSPVGRTAVYGTRRLSFADITEPPAGDPETLWPAVREGLEGSHKEEWSRPFDLEAIAPAVFGFAQSWRYAKSRFMGARWSPVSGQDVLQQRNSDLQLLAQDAADFVTPGDLRHRCQSLCEQFQLK